EATRVAPRLAFAHYLLGRAREIRGEEEPAEKSTREAIALDGDFAPAHLQLGRLLLARAYKAGLGVPPGAGPARKKDMDRLTLEAAGEIESALGRGAALDDSLHKELARALLACAREDRAAAIETSREGLARFADKEGREEFLWILGMATLSGEER